MKGTVTKKGKRWYICYPIGKDANGKRILKWESSWDTKRDAERVLRLRISELEGTFEHKADKSTLAEFLEYWLKTCCAPRLAANTVRGYEVNVRKHIIPYIGKMQLSRIKPRDIQELYSKLADEGLSGTSIRYVHNNLHRAFGYAVKQQLICKNPAEFTEPPRVRKYDASALTPQQVTRLLHGCHGREVYLPVLLAVSLGLRRGEALGLRWSDVDFTNGTVSITHSASFGKKGFVLSDTKTKSSNRTLKMTDTLISALNEALEAQQHSASLGGKGFNPYNLVCCRLDGSPYSFNALQHHFSDVLDACGLPHIRFHDLRHTNATLMLRNNVSPKIVSALLGHSSIGVTMDTYSHVLVDMQDGAVNAMESVLKDI